MIWLKSFIFIVYFVTTSSAYCFNESIWNVSSSENGLTDIEFKKNQSHVQINCYNSPPKFLDCHFKKLKEIQSAEQSAHRITFLNCQLPDELKISEIVHQVLNNTNIETLNFFQFDLTKTTLNIDGSNFRDLKSLKFLTIQSINSIHITSDLLHYLPNLERLNLQGNSLEKLPNKFLTPLKAELTGSNETENENDQLNLTELDLQENKIREIDEHAFDSCTSLKSIALFSNYLNTLPADLFAPLLSLRSLDISKNNFSSNTLPPGLLKNNKNLESLDFYENKQSLITLPTKFFANLSKLVEIDLHGNGIEYLPADLFFGANDLMYLDLNNNSLTNLNRDLFNGCPNLSSINLAGNKIRVLNDEFFLTLPDLVISNLARNRIDTYSGSNYTRENKNDTIFDKCSEYSNLALYSIDLSMNNLSIIEPSVFTNHPCLRSININSNKLKTLHPKIFTPFHHKKLTDLDLSHNNILELPSTLFSNLTRIYIIKINNNALKELPSGLFNNTVRLIYLDVANNLLTTVPNFIFLNCGELDILHLNNNKIKTLGEYAFVGLWTLTILDLSNNHMTSLPCNVFQQLLDLEELNMEKNRLLTVKSCFMNALKNLEVAKFSYNYLTLDNEKRKKYYFSLRTSPFYMNKKIKELYLDNNKISEIYGDWLALKGLEYLNLSNNKLKYLKGIYFQFIAENVEVDVTNNNISFISFSEVQSQEEHWLKNYLTILRNSTQSKSIKIYAKKNPLICDCNLYSLFLYMEKKMDRLIYEKIYLDVDMPVCHEPSWLNVTFLQAESYRCLLSESNDFNVTCPNECECWMRPSANSYDMNCKNGNLTTIKLPTLPALKYEEKLNISDIFHETEED